MELGGGEASAPARPRLRHLPALDGLRGLAVVAVLLFHAELLRGGYLGVDAFFVLSGFLITSLLLGELAGEQRIDLVAFWGRRFRRLLPAALALVAGVAVYAVVLAEPSELAGLRADALATLGYVANWWSIGQAHGYWELFETPSPLEHTWSLAIEEQFYVVWPLVVAGVAWVVRRRAAGGPAAQPLVHRTARSLLFVTSLGALASAALMGLLYEPGGDANRVYMGTDTRAAGILVGAALAAWVVWRGQPATGWRGRRLTLELAALTAAAALAVAWATVDGTTPVLYRGGFLACGLAAVLVIAAAAHPEQGPLARALSWQPLRWLGTISYGLYLWHWPVYVVLSEARTGLDGPVLLFVRLHVSLVLAVASYWVVEQPVRRGRLRRVPMPVGAPLGILAAGVAVALATVPVDRPPPVQVAATAPTPPGGAVGSDPAATGLAGRRLLFVGDSVANSIAGGSDAIRSLTGLEVANAAVNGCQLDEEVTALRVLYADGTVKPTPLNPPCLPAWRAGFARARPDVVVVVYGNAVGFEQLRLRGRWVGACDAAYRSWYLDRMTSVLTEFRDAGAAVVLSTLPYTDAHAVLVDGREPIDCANELNREVAASVDGVRLLDLAGFVCPDGRCVRSTEGAAVRPDGVHFGEPVGGDPANGFRGAGADWVSRWVATQATALAAAELAGARAPASPLGP